MLSPNKPIIAPAAVPRFRTGGFSGVHIAVMVAVFTVLISIPIWTHQLPPLADYVNHLARMHVIATLSQDPQLANFYEIQLADDSQSDHGSDRAAAGAGDERLCRRPGFSWSRCSR